MIPTVIDTNNFLRFLLNDIPEQKKEFEKLIKKAIKSKKSLIVPQIVIFEINFTLEKYYHYPKEEIIEKLQSIISAPYFVVQDSSVFQMSIRLFSENNLSLADCFIFAYSKDNQADLFTFDENLKKLSKK